MSKIRHRKVHSTFKEFKEYDQWIIKNYQELTETETGMVVTKGWVVGEIGRHCSKGTKFQL